MRISIQINKLFIIWRKLWIRFVTLCMLDLVTISKCITKPYCVCYMFQLHPDALYLLGAVYLTGDCVKKDIASALWCFHRASEKVIYQLIQFKELIFFKTLHCVLNSFCVYGQNVYSYFFTCGELE